MINHTNSRLRPRAIVALVVALVFAACGGGNLDPTADGGLIAPTPIHVVGSGGSAAIGGSGADAASLLAPEVASADQPIGSTSMIAPFVVYDFIVGPGMPALPANTSGWQYPLGAAPDLNRIAEMAAALGVSGEVAARSANQGGGWIVGPDDGSAPALWVASDAQLSWWFNIPYTGVYGEGCVTPDSGPVDDSAAAREDEPAVESETEPVAPVECVFEEPTPPAGILTADQARTRANDMLVALGEDPAEYDIEVYADEWYASVTALQRIGGITSPVGWYFGFGTDGVLENAAGVLARPQEVGPYPLVDIDTALTRLGGGFFGGIGTLSIDSIALGAPVDSCGEDTSCTESDPQEPEHIEVTLVDVRPDLWWTWDGDGTVWLLPAYTFEGSDGGRYTAPAVTDEFLIMDDVLIDPYEEATPPPAEEVQPPTDENGGIVEKGSVISDEDAATLVGLSEDEAIATAENSGWLIRVVARDGEDFAVTLDYQPDRVNLTIDDGIITAATVG